MLTVGHRCGAIRPIRIIDTCSGLDFAQVHLNATLRP